MTFAVQRVEKGGETHFAFVTRTEVPALITRDSHSLQSLSRAKSGASPFLPFSQMLHAVKGSTAPTATSHSRNIALSSRHSDSLHEKRNMQSSRPSSTPTDGGRTACKYEKCINTVPAKLPKPTLFTMISQDRRLSVLNQSSLIHRWRRERCRRQVFLHGCFQFSTLLL